MCCMSLIYSRVKTFVRYLQRVLETVLYNIIIIFIDVDECFITYVDIDTFIETRSLRNIGKI